jgi:hypothetical protein
MPISTNAPFNEFGQSQILRDIEQLYLALNARGTGSPGDAQTQDQSSANTGDTSPAGSVSAGGGTGSSVALPPTGPNGETLSFIEVTACVNGVDTSIFIYGYVAP